MYLIKSFIVTTSTDSFAGNHLTGNDKQP